METLTSFKKSAGCPAIPKGPWAVRIASKLLGEDIYVVDSENTKATLKDKDEVVTYTADEIVEILGMSREDIVELHEIKKIFIEGVIKEVHGTAPVGSLFA